MKKKTVFLKRSHLMKNYYFLFFFNFHIVEKPLLIVKILFFCSISIKEQILYNSKDHKNFEHCIILWISLNIRHNI